MRRFVRDLAFAIAEDLDELYGMLFVILLSGLIGALIGLAAGR